MSRRNVDINHIVNMNVLMAMLTKLEWRVERLNSNIKNSLEQQIQNYIDHHIHMVDASMTRCLEFDWMW